jgi:hypothetical protein
VFYGQWRAIHFQREDRLRVVGQVQGDGAVEKAVTALPHSATAVQPWMQLSLVICDCSPSFRSSASDRDTGF